MKNVSSLINTNSFGFDITAPGLLNDNFSYCIRNIYQNANHRLKNPISENAVMHIAGSWLQESNFIYAKSAKDWNRFEYENESGKYSNQLKQVLIQIGKILFTILSLIICISDSCSYSRDFPLFIPPPPT